MNGQFHQGRKIGAENRWIDCSGGGCRRYATNEDSIANFFPFCLFSCRLNHGFRAQQRFVQVFHCEEGLWENSSSFIDLIVLHQNHFRKDWQTRVRTWFDQPGRKLRRRQARKVKAATLGVRPLNLLRPAVRAQTVRYNRKIREGRGFTLAELKEAGIGKKEARGIGIVVDHRRRNLSEEGKALNVERLKVYKTRLIVFPRNAKKPKKGDSTVSDVERIMKLFYVS